MVNAKAAPAYLGLLFNSTNNNLVTPTNITFVNPSISNSVLVTNLTSFIRGFSTNYSFLSVKDFGATGNGVTDDTISASNAVVAANIAGKTLVYPPGVYKQSTVLLTNNTRVIGYGATIYQISITNIPSNYATAGGVLTNVPKVSPGFYAYRSTNILVEGFIFTQAPTADFFGGAQPAVQTFYSSDVIIRNNKFAQTNDTFAVALYAGKNLQVYDNDFGKSILQTGQMNLYNDVYWDATYDSATTYGLEDVLVQRNQFAGTNAAVRARIVMTGVQSFRIAHNTFDNVSTKAWMIEGYCGDRGLHYFDGRVSTNANWIIEGNRGTNGWWGGITGAIIRLMGTSGAPVEGFPDTQLVYTGYGCIVRDNTWDGGIGKHVISTHLIGATYQNNYFSVDAEHLIFAENGFSDYSLFLNNRLELRDGVQVVTTAIAKNSIATNSNWILDGNTIIGNSGTPTFIWHPTLLWNNLTLKNNTWIVKSTNLVGATDSLFRVTYTNRFTLNNEQFLLTTTNTYWDTNLFALTATAGSDIDMRGVRVIPSSSMPIYAGLFTSTGGFFDRNEMGAASFTFTERGSLSKNKFITSSTTRVPLTITSTPKIDLAENRVEQTAASSVSAISITSSTNNSKNNYILANTTATAITVVNGTMSMENPYIINAGVGGLYTGTVTTITNELYPIIFSRPNAQGSGALQIDNEWSGTRDIQIIPLPANGTAGVANYFWNGTFRRFAYGFNPINRQFEIGTNSTRPFIVTENGALTTATATISGTTTHNGDVAYTKTITASGTTGAQTINKNSGRVNFAAGAQTLVVTDSLVTTNSIILAMVKTDDATALSVKVSSQSTGSFTLKLNATATAETSVDFMVSQ